MTITKLTRSQQARINGAKSKGPISIAGKSISSKNSLKHGFAAAINNVIGVEDEADWQPHLAGYRASFLPQCYVEDTLVDQLASINWRQSRLVGLETALIDAQISIQEENVCDIYPDEAENPYYHFVLAWQGLARQPQRPPTRKESSEPVDSSIPPDGYDISSIELVRRYLTTLDRQYRNTLLNLRQYRKDFAPQQNEPANQAPKIEEAPIPNPQPADLPAVAVAAPAKPMPTIAPAQDQPALSMFRTVKQSVSRNGKRPGGANGSFRR